MLYMSFLEGVVVALGKGHSGTINAVKISPDEKVLSFFLTCLPVCMIVCLSSFTDTYFAPALIRLFFFSMTTDYRFSGKYRGDIILGNAVC